MVSSKSHTGRAPETVVLGMENHETRWREPLGPMGENIRLEHENRGTRLREPWDSIPHCFPMAARTLGFSRAIA